MAKPTRSFSRLYCKYLSKRGRLMVCWNLPKVPLLYIIYFFRTSDFKFYSNVTQTIWSFFCYTNHFFFFQIFDRNQINIGFHHPPHWEAFKSLASHSKLIEREFPVSGSTFEFGLFRSDFVLWLSWEQVLIDC